MSLYNTILTVHANHTAHLNGRLLRCALGKNGITHDKKEGDNKTPVGVHPVRQLYYRPDVYTVPPITALPIIALTPHDGWCDDVQSPLYNTFISLPHSARHEKLWREDTVYDLILVLGHNDNPPLAGKGSAIFMHLARDGYEGTEGCIAFNRAHMEWIITQLTPQSYVEVQKA